MELGGGGLSCGGHGRIVSENPSTGWRTLVGLTLSPETIPNHLLFEGGDGTTLLVYGRPSPNLADHTQVRFWCADVAADVSELVGRGVEFDLVEFGDFKMIDHVLTTPVGKLSVVQRPGWQHHRALPARLAAPLRCRREESRSSCWRLRRVWLSFFAQGRTTPAWVADPRSKAGYRDCRIRSRALRRAGPIDWPS